MIRKKINMETVVIGLENGRETYEICRTWNEEGGKALVIELYPTISWENPMILDVSTMHLLNHAEELGWGMVRIINLYPTVFDVKPLVGDLAESVANMEYIRDVLSEKDIAEYDIVIAYGNGLLSHACTQHLKEKIMKMIVEKGLSLQVKHIVTDSLDTKKQLGTHPLFLGLRHNHEKWQLEKYPIKIEAAWSLKESSEKAANSNKKGKKERSVQNVPETKESD